MSLERLPMSATAEVIKQMTPIAENSKTEFPRDEKQTLVLGTTGAGKTVFQVESLLKQMEN